MKITTYKGNLKLLDSLSKNKTELNVVNKIGLPLLHFERQKRSFLLLEKYCKTYSCPCYSVSIGLIELDENEINVENPKNVFFNVDLQTWEEIENPDRQIDVQDIIDEFLREIPIQLKKRFRKGYKENKERIKRYLASKIPIKDITEGYMISYSKVFHPEGSVLDGKTGISFSFEFENRKYFIEDLYCMSPECDCQEARFMFMELNKEKKVLSDIFSVTLSFQNKIEFDFFENYTKIEAIRLFSKWRESFPALLHTVNYRYDEMKTVGRELIISDLSRTERLGRKKKKIGRNDPCPCGSGKKYKKCCLMSERI